MKNFRDYKGFIFDLNMFISTKTDPGNNYIVEFTCLEPILKDNIPSYKRVSYIEVCCIGPDNDIIWFDDWYEGYQTSFSIISITSVYDVSKLQKDYEKLKINYNYLCQVVGDIEDSIGQAKERDIL